MKISIKCPISLLKIEWKNREMGMRNLWEVYKKINIGDMGEMLNFGEEESFYHQTCSQRMRDIEKELGVGIDKKYCVIKELYNKYQIVRVLKLTQKEEIKISKREEKTKEFKNKMTIGEFWEKKETKRISEKKWIKAIKSNIDVYKIFDKNKLKEKGIVERESNHKIGEGTQKVIQKVLCEEGGNTPKQIV